MSAAAPTESSGKMRDCSAPAALRSLSPPSRLIARPPQGDFRKKRGEAGQDTKRKVENRERGTVGPCQLARAG